VTARRAGARAAAAKSLAEIASAPDWHRPGLSLASRGVAFAAIEALLSDRAVDGELEPPDAAWVERVVADYDQAVGATSRQVRVGTRVLLWLLEWLPPVVTRVRSRMSRLPLGERVRYLDALEHHGHALFTMLLIATKVPMLMSAFERDEPLRSTGFDRPTTFARRRLPFADRPSP
jgi:hypothetical protein